MTSMSSPSASRSDRRRRAKSSLKATAASLTSEKLIKRAAQALAPDLASFVLLFWEGGDPASRTAIIRFEALQTRSILNLLLPAFEHAVTRDLKAKGQQAPALYHEIMEHFLAQVRQAYADADLDLRALDEQLSRKKSEA